MEGIILFIIVIVVLNMLGRLIGGGRRQQAPPPKRRRRMPEETWSERTKDRRSEDLGPQRPLPGYFEDEDDTTGEQDLKQTYQAREQKTVSGRASVQLQEMLTNKNSLRAAFIFHELLKPPLSVRKRSKNRMYD